MRLADFPITKSFQFSEPIIFVQTILSLESLPPLQVSSLNLSVLSGVNLESGPSSLALKMF